MNVFDFAMQMEVDGKAHYEKLEAETPVAGLQKIFSILAADEQKHYDVVNEMRSGETREMTDSTALEQAKSIFLDLQIDGSLLEMLRTKMDAFRYAMRIEADSIRLYEGISQQENGIGNPAVVPLVQKIIDEEKKHYNIAENICGLIAANERMIPWHEFDGIKEIRII
jgi:rubrerythrin